MGEFPIEDSSKLIPLYWIELAQERWREVHGNGDGGLRTGVDVAGMGRDSTVFARRKGDVVESLKSFIKLGNMEIVGRLQYEIESGDAMIDTIGEGAGVYSRGQELGMRVISAKFSESTDLTDMTGQRRFANTRAYCYWSVRDALNPELGGKLALPDDEQLKEELNEPTYRIRSDGKILIEEKDEIKRRLGRSPDKADAVALTYWPENPPAAVASLDPEPEIKRRRW